MLRVGLTGGIASGKTTVANELARHGAVIIDADELAREVVEPGTPGFAAVVRRFGEGVLRDERLDRAALARIVFADPQARRDLENVIHPEVRRRAAERERALPHTAVVVHVIPLLVETGKESDFDLCVVVDVDRQTQLARLMARGPMSREEAESRIAAQATREQRLAAADIVIPNVGTLTDLTEQVDDLWSDLISVHAGE
jgi:dephospho-CoA kinase